MSLNLTDYVRPFLRSGLTGGGASNLDGIATVGLTVPVNGLVCTGGVAYVYQLVAGTDATSSPAVIRPTDYDGTTNQKVWKLQTVTASAMPDATGSTKGAVELAGDLGGTAASPAVNGAAGSFQLKGEIAPTALSGGNTNDWNPTGLSGAALIKVSTAGFAGACTLTGLQGGAAGRVICLHATGLGTASSLVLSHDDANSSAANRFYIPGSASITVQSRALIVLIYSTNLSRWVVNTVGLASTSIAGTIMLAGDLSNTGSSPQVNGATGAFQFKGLLTPAQITSNQNDYAPSNFSSNTVIRVSSDAARTITGMNAGSLTGLYKVLYNAGSYPITLSHESASSSAVNRFHFSSGVDFTLSAGMAVAFIWDNTLSRWIHAASGMLPLAGGTMTGRLTLLQVANTQAALTYGATTNLDFDAGSAFTLSLTGDVTFTTSNRAAGKMLKVKILCDASARNFTWPSWIPLGAALPANIAASKTAMLTLECWGANDTDITASYSVQP